MDERGLRTILVMVIINYAHCDDNSSGKHNVGEFQPSWTYKCQGEACYRSESPLAITNNSKSAPIKFFKNVDVCHMVCGRFGSLWPKPTLAILSKQVVKINPNYMRFDLVDAPVETRQLLSEMTQVVTNNLLLECGGNVTELVDKHVVVFITVYTPSLVLDWETNEQYMLDVQIKGNEIFVHIVAETVYGARHALEAFTQLVSASRPEQNAPDKCGLVLVSGAKIRDKPIFRHRGLLLDTARNFIPLKDIKRMIDGMATAKMNVFHWHVTDSHSFPLESSRVPQFTRYGAYSASNVYTMEEVRDLIKYARIRGVRVMIEIDAPAHAGNGWQWGKVSGYGDLAVCVNANPWINFCTEPPCGQLNPANPNMYKVLRDLYRDIAELLPRPTLLHMGGDEVNFACWNSSKEIVSYMQEKGFENNREGFIQLWAEFHAKALQAWDEEYRASGGEGQQPVMLWSSLLTQPERIEKYLFKRRYVIEVWETVGSPLLLMLLRMGYRAVAVPKDLWYMDHGFWGNTKYSDWRRMYAHTLPNKQNMLGGEVAMWTELVDVQGLDARIWPRAAAVAERLWSDPTSSAKDAEPRLQRLRNRLIVRGLKPDVLSPTWCTEHDMLCL